MKINESEYSIENSNFSFNDEVEDQTDGKLKNEQENGNEALDPFLDKFFNKEAKNRNFSVKISNEKNGSVIILEKKDGEDVDLSKYIPKGYKLLPAEEFICNQRDKIISFNPEGVNKRGFLLNLAHEIGHSRSNKIFEEFRTNLIKKTKAVLINQIEEGVRLCEEMINSKNQERIEKLRNEFSSEKVEHFIPDKYFEMVSKVNAISERKAWAASLKILRSLEKDGFNVFDEFESVEEVRTHIAYCLLSHEFDSPHRHKSIKRGNKPKTKFIKSRDIDLVQEDILKNDGL